MSAVEEIEAAIAKLTKLRDETRYGELNGWLYEMPEDTSGYWGGPDDDPRQPITNDPLMVTLHRTIDAQLALIQAVAALNLGPTLDDLPGGFFGRTVDLARAINATS